MIKILFGIIVFATVFSIFAIPETAQAQDGLVPCGRDIDGDPMTTLAGEAPCGFCHLYQLGVNVITFLLVPSTFNGGFAIVPILVAFMFAWGGFVWITAIGNPTRVQAGKKVILAGIIGILIVYGAWLFINLFLDALNVTTFSGTGNWWQINCSY